MRSMIIALMMLSTTAYAQTEQQNLAQLADELAGCAISTGDSDSYRGEFEKAAAQFLKGDRHDMNQMTAPHFAQALEAESVDPTVSSLWRMTTERYTEAFAAHPGIDLKKFTKGCEERLVNL